MSKKKRLLLLEAKVEILFKQMRGLELQIGEESLFSTEEKVIKKALKNLKKS